jgi:hypothetical protein
VAKLTFKEREALKSAVVDRDLYERIMYCLEADDSIELEPGTLGELTNLFQKKLNYVVEYKCYVLA